MFQKYLSKINADFDPTGNQCKQATGTLPHVLSCHVQSCIDFGNRFWKPFSRICGKAVDSCILIHNHLFSLALLDAPFNEHNMMALLFAGQQTYFL